MNGRNTNSGFSITGRIDTQVHDKETLRQAADNYNELSKEEKLQLSRDIEPAYEDTVYNVTTDKLHEYFVDNLDPGQTDSKDNVTTAWLGLGTNAGGGTASTDTDLNNRVYEKPVTDVGDNGKDIVASTFIASDEGNGGNSNDFNELGLFSGDPTNLSNNDVFLMNHATFNIVTKDNTKTVTFDVTLTFSDS